MKAEVIREIAEKEAAARSPNNRATARLYAGTLPRQITEAIRILEQAGFVVLPKDELEAALKIVSAAEWIWRANDAHTNRIALRGAASSSRDECNTALANLVTEFTADDLRRAAALLAAITEETKNAE